MVLFMQRFEFYFFRTVKGIYLHLDLNEEMRDTENGQKIVGQFIKK